MIRSSFKKLIMVLLLLPACLSAQEVADTIKLDPVTIRDNYLNKVPYVKSEIGRNDVLQLATRDAAEVLRGIPNVSGIRKGGINLDPVVRGFKFSQIGVIMNGGINIEGGCPNRMDPTASHVNMDEVEKIEIYKGPYALRFGPNFGGVINFITAKPVPFSKAGISLDFKKTYETNWNGHKEHIMIKGGGSRIYFLVSGGRSDYGNYRDGGGRQVMSEFNHYDYQARLGISPWKRHEFIVSYGGQYGRNVRFPSLPMDERKDNTSLMSVDYKAVNPGKMLSSIVAKVYRADVEHIMDNINRSNSDTMSSVATVNAITTGGRAEAMMQFGEKHFLYAGLSFLDVRKDGDRVRTMIMQPPSNGIIPVRSEKLWNKAWVQNTGLYAEYRYSFGAWDLLAAARADYNKAGSGNIELFNNATPPQLILSNDTTDSDFFNLSGAAGITRHLGDRFSLGFTLGRGVRSPNVLERFIILLPVGYDNFEYMGNPRLKPETNNEADLVFRFTHEKAGGFELNLFYSYVQDFILGKRLPSSVQKPLTMNVLGVKKFINAGDATFTGFEFSYQTPVAWTAGGGLTAAYTYASIASVTKQILDLTKIPSQQVTGEEEISGDALPEIPPLEFKARVNYKFFKGKLLPEISYRYVMEQNHVSEAFYEPETPSFGVAGVSVLYTYNSFLSVAAGVSNLFDEEYYEHLNRRIVGSTLKLFEPGRSFYINLFIHL